MIRRPPSSTPFPYTTLFRSLARFAHHDLATICNTRWGQDARAVTAAMKAEAYRLYHATKTAKVCCEVDHLNSRDTGGADVQRSEEHTSELQSRLHLVCRPLL